MPVWHNMQTPSCLKALNCNWRIKWLLLLLASGLYLFGSGAYIFAKANLAQYLIARAWQLSLQDQLTHRPWPWADTYPVAELKIKHKSWYVLAGANARNLAFAPSHLSATVLPGNSGNSVVVGHRDTQFNSLKDVQPGDIIEVQNMQHSTRYRVTALHIVEASQLRLWQTGHEQNFDQASLSLITCYPFDSILPNPSQRFIVSALHIE